MNKNIKKAGLLKAIDFEQTFCYNVCIKKGVRFMSDKIYTVDDIKMMLHPIFSGYNIKKAVLFGSYVKGAATEGSDVDLLLDSGLKGLKFVGLIEDIRLALDKEVDVFDVTHINPQSRISSEIQRYGVTIYEE